MLCTARTLHGQSSSGVASRSAVNSPTGWPYRWPNAETGTHAVIRCVVLPTKPNNACPESHEEIMAADNATASPGPTFHEMLDFGKGADYLRGPPTAERDAVDETVIPVFGRCGDFAGAGKSPSMISG